MRKLKITFLLAAVTLVAALLPTLSASADDVKTVDEPHTICEVEGHLVFDEGISETPKLDEYIFVDSGSPSLNCDQLAPGGFDSSYSMAADGDTDSIWHDGTGEDCDQGGWDQSDADGNGDTTGDLSATRIAGPDKLGSLGPASLYGDVKFHRLGTVVYAHGNLRSSYVFSGEVQFTPPLGQDCRNEPITHGGVAGYVEIDDI